MSILPILALATLSLEPKVFQYPNGTRLVVVEDASAKNMGFWLMANSIGLNENPASYGWRHMLEHFLASQVEPIQSRLERKGIMFLATTGPSYMKLGMSCPATSLSDCTVAIKMVLNPLQVTQEDIAKEAKIIGHELAIRGSSMRAYTAITLSMDGTVSPEAGGDPAALATATPRDLLELQRQLFAPSRLVLLVTGPVKANEVSRLAQPLLQQIPWAEPTEPWKAPQSNAKFGKPRYNGYAGALVNKSFVERESLANIFVGSMLEIIHPELECVFDSEMVPSVVTLWSPDENVQKLVKDTTLGEVQFAQVIARQLAEGIGSSAEESGEIFVQGLFANIPFAQKRLVKSLNELGLQDVQDALERWKAVTFEPEGNR